MREQWSGTGSCRSCTTTVALTFETEVGVKHLPRAVICPLCLEAIHLSSMYRLLTDKDAEEESHA